jgi:hypothetical protein
MVPNNMVVELSIRITIFLFAMILDIMARLSLQTYQLIIISLNLVQEVMGNNLSLSMLVKTFSGNHHHHLAEADETKV